MLLEGIVDIMTGEKKLHYPHFHGGCRGNRIFLPYYHRVTNFSL